VINEVKVNNYFVKEVSFCVYSDEKECEVKYTCGLFELRGILCMPDYFDQNIFLIDGMKLFTFLLRVDMVV
jgi:hypothetical protein